MVSNQDLESPINQYQQLMAITAEECGELVQVCMKIMRKYDNLYDTEQDKYRDLLVEEAGDVYCMLELTSSHGLFDQQEIFERADVKKEKLRAWSDLDVEDH